MSSINVQDVQKASYDSTVQPASEKKSISIDEALTRIRFGTFNYIIIFISGFGLFAVTLEICCIGFILPVSQCDLKLTANQKGLLTSVSYIGIILSSHLWGYLSDTKGRRRVLLPTILIACLTSVCSSFSPNFFLLTLFRFLNGFFMSALSSIIYAYLSEFHAGAKRARAIMGSTVVYGISVLLLPLIAWLVINYDWHFYIPLLDIEYKPWRLYLAVCSLPGLLTFIVLLLLPESPKFVLGQGNQSGAIKILEKVNRWNNGSNAILDIVELEEESEAIECRRRISQIQTHRVPLLKSIWEQTAPLFQSPYLRPTVLLCSIQFLISISAYGLYMWLPEILNRVANSLKGTHDERITMCELINIEPMSVSHQHGKHEPTKCITKLELEALEQDFILEFIFAIGVLLIRFLINRVGKFVILIILFSLCGVGSILCAYIDVPIVFISSLLILLCDGMAVNVISAVAVEIYPTNIRAMAVSISLMFTRLGSIAGSNMVVFLIDSYCNEVFLMIGFTIFASGILAFFVPKIHEKATKSI